MLCQICSDSQSACCSASKARPGRIFLLLSPAERAAIGPYGSSDGELSCAANLETNRTRSLSSQSSGQSSWASVSLSSQASSSRSAASSSSLSRASSASTPRGCGTEDLLPPVTPFISARLPAQMWGTDGELICGSAPQAQSAIRTIDSAPPLMLQDRSGSLLCSSISMLAPGQKGDPLQADDRIIRKSLSADTETHGAREQLLPLLAQQAAAAAATPADAQSPARPTSAAVAKLLLRTPDAALPPGREPSSLSTCCNPAVRVRPGIVASPGLEELQRLRRAIAAFGLHGESPSCGAREQQLENLCGMQRISIVVGDGQSARSTSANVAAEQNHNACMNPTTELLPPCMSAPDTLSESVKEASAPQQPYTAAAMADHVEGPHQATFISTFTLEARASPEAAAPPQDASTAVPADGTASQEANATGVPVRASTEAPEPLSAPAAAAEMPKTASRAALKAGDAGCRPLQPARRVLPKLSARHPAFLALLLIACSVLPGVAIMSLVALAVLLLAWQLPGHPECQSHPVELQGANPCPIDVINPLKVAITKAASVQLKQF